MLLTGCGSSLGDTTSVVSQAPEETTTTSAPSTSTTPTTVGSGYDPIYSGACIPSGPEVDCGDTAPGASGLFEVDVHRLDADSGGIA